MKPFIKWAGGKTQLLEKLVSKLPPKFNDYYEPLLEEVLFYFIFNLKQYLLMTSTDN